MNRLEGISKKWMKANTAVAQVSSEQDELVELNVGGTYKFTTTKKLLTLAKGSLLEQTFSGVHKLKVKDGSIFLDRDGDIFKIMMNMLRSEGSLIPKNLDPYTKELLDAELKYWKVEPQKLQLEYKLNPKLLELLNSEPKMDSNKSLKPL